MVLVLHEPDRPKRHGQDEHDHYKNSLHRNYVENLKNKEKHKLAGLYAKQGGVNQEIKRAGPDKDKKLNIMRGFFFWLEHLTQQDAFQPWEDAECLQTKPGSS
ncbi:hypothetical protein MTR67_019823 [Solanum verrucosum]|uniref:Uncharacterized protein n=1 Tax=Solanum verrucosum TaxID=315347 RepID=A0AAF0TV65_SOLVR|nr:hypothetical protein MTR67_019823 [Solanum verrucosum]